jgi:hypothetical protein
MTRIRAFPVCRTALGDWIFYHFGGREPDKGDACVRRVLYGFPVEARADCGQRSPLPLAIVGDQRSALDAVCRSDDALFLHALDDPRRPVVANA